MQKERRRWRRQRIWFRYMLTAGSEGLRLPTNSRISPKQDVNFLGFGDQGHARDTQIPRNGQSFVLLPLESGQHILLSSERDQGEELERLENDRSVALKINGFRRRSRQPSHNSDPPRRLHPLWRHQRHQLAQARSVRSDTVRRHLATWA